MGKQKDDKNKIEIVSAGAEPGAGGGPLDGAESSPSENLSTGSSVQNGSGSESDDKRKSKEQQRNEQYNRYVEQVTPKANCLLNCVKAFITGGCICTIGQILTVLFLNSGMGKDEAAAYTTICLVFASVVLTGLNIYPLITTWGGAGSLVPITGFANSVVAPAIEYKKEGQVFGIGCKIFTISGPVILYGILSSWILGVIYLIVVSLRAV